MDDLVHVPSVHLEVQLEHGLPDVLVVFFAATHLEICSGKSANTWFQMILKSSSCMSVTHHFQYPAKRNIVKHSWPSDAKRPIQSRAQHHHATRAAGRCDASCGSEGPAGKCCFSLHQLLQE